MLLLLLLPGMWQEERQRGEHASLQWFDPADLRRKASAVWLVIHSKGSTVTRPVGVCDEAADAAVARYRHTKTRRHIEAGRAATQGS